MATPLSNFHAPLRVLLGDRDPDIHIYDSDQLTDGLRLTLNLGKVEGYELGDDEESVEPSLIPKEDPTAFARLLYHTAKVFVATLTANSFRTRAFSESFGHAREHIDSIINEVHAMENGEQSD